MGAISGVVLLVATAVAQESAPPAPSRVADVVVRGAVSTDPALITRTLAIPPQSSPAPGRIRRAVRDLWKLGLFSDIRLDSESTPQGERLIVTVTEVPRLTSLEIAGNKKIGTEDLKGKLTLRAGQLLSRRKLWESCRAVEAAYEEEGYAGARCLAEVTPSAADSQQAALTLRVDEGSRVKIVGVDITGNQAFTDKDLRGELKLKPNSLFRRKRYTAERYREDRARLEEFYKNHGYRDAVVTTAGASFGEDGRSVVLRYHVEEGRYYVFGKRTWTGNSAVPTELLESAAHFRKGDPFSQEKLEQTTGEAYNLYTDKGYLLEISVSPEASVSGDSVDVAYRIEEGRPSHVRELQIRGNRQTKERVIRRELKLFPGDLLRRSLLMRSQRDVMALGFFEEVGLDYRPTGEGTDVDLIFNVKEKSTGQASGGVGYSSETGLTGFVQLGHPNLFGNGQNISLSLERGGRRENYEISFTDPWVFGHQTSFGFDLFNTRRERDLYSETRRGGGINLGRPWPYRFPDFMKVFVGYSLEDFKFNDFDASLESTESASDGVPLADRLRQSSGVISSAYLTALRVSTDDPFYPKLGARTQMRFEVAGGMLGGDQHYFKPTIDHRVYFQPIGPPALMLRWRLGWLAALSGKHPPTTETFRLGGTRPFEYLRGYDDYYIVPEENVRGTGAGQVRFPGGRAMLAFTAELQFPVVNPVHGLLFFDAGDTWNHASDVGLASLKESYGVGLRFEIPLLGNIGFDYAYGTAVKDWRFHFIVGAAF